jgi:hypothetical protein
VPQSEFCSHSSPSSIIPLPQTGTVVVVVVVVGIVVEVVVVDVVVGSVVVVI